MFQQIPRIPHGYASYSGSVLPSAPLPYPRDCSSFSSQHVGVFTYGMSVFGFESCTAHDLMTMKQYGMRPPQFRYFFFPPVCLGGVYLTRLKECAPLYDKMQHCCQSFDRAPLENFWKREYLMGRLWACQFERNKDVLTLIKKKGGN